MQVGGPDALLSRWRGEVLRLLLAAKRHDLQLQLAQHQAVAASAALRRQLIDQGQAHIAELSECTASSDAALARCRDEAAAAAGQLEADLVRAREEAAEALSREQRAAGVSRRLELELGSARSELAAIGNREALAELELRQLQEELMQRAADADQSRQAEQAAAARARSLQVATPACRLAAPHNHFQKYTHELYDALHVFLIALQVFRKTPQAWTISMFLLLETQPIHPRRSWYDDHLRHTELNVRSAKLTCAG